MYCYRKRDKNKNPRNIPFLFTAFFGLTKDSQKTIVQMSSHQVQKIYRRDFYFNSRRALYIFILPRIWHSNFLKPPILTQGTVLRLLR